MSDPTFNTTAEAAHDKAYREGWMQAWREWSACVIGETVFHKPQMSVEDYVRMERRRQEMESYGKQS